MEFHIRKSSDNECSQSYIFNPEDLADIPHPDDYSDKNSPQEDIDLPLPPGTSGDDFPIPLGFKLQPAKNSNNAFTFSQNEGLEKSSDLDPGLMSENFNILPLSECMRKTGFGAELENDEVNKPMDIVDDSKYSPSKMDSDEDNQDLITTKPKVLGKEQAKKRLMAFSLSKQPSASLKKQSKAVTPVKNKEKPPNPNKGTNVQEQFRATISAIEEEKKKMFQNMPNYLFHEMNDLTKSYSSPSSQLLEKLKNERSDSKGKNSSSRDGRSSNRSPESTRKKKSSRKNRSRSNSPYKSKKRRRSRSKRRSRSNSKSRRRSHSRSRNRRSRSHSKRRRAEKNYKSTKEDQSEPKKKSPENWSCYKSGGSVVENSSKSDTKPRHTEHNRRSRSPINRTDFKPIFNYFNKGCNSAMTSLQARPADPNNSTPALFSEKTLKFTRTKPILCWAENPLQATDYYMSREMLLENCDQTTASILLSIIENKNIGTLEKQFEPQTSKSRPWYPRDDYLLTNVNNDVESNESSSCKKPLNLDAVIEKEQSETYENKKDIDNVKEEAKNGRASFERKISLVNDSYLSDEDDRVKEMIMGEMKVQLDLDKNCVKVRSKWDSDYEGETSEKESVSQVTESREISQESDVKDKKVESLDFNLDPQKPPEKKKGESANLSGRSVTHVESPNANPKSDAAAGNLVSEYEEFLKMVSVDSSDNQTEKTLPELTQKLERTKTKKTDKATEETRKSPKLGLTDWDQESDHEEKLGAKKAQFTRAGSHDEFLVLKEEKLDGKKEGKRKKKSEKKSETLKERKVKTSKKSGKVKKKKYSYSEDSSSESNDSDSDSDDSESSGKKKSKKYSKTKKKSKKVSSNESDSYSDESATKRKKSRQKKSRKKKDSSSDSDQVQNSPLKQLDYKKQIIMKNIEEIDYISDKSAKKKKKESRTRKKDSDSSEDTGSEKYNKAGKKKKSEVKAEKEKKKSKTGIKKNKLLGKTKKNKKSETSSESDSETSEDSMKKKKSKKSEKKKQDRSEDSSSDEKGKKSTKSKSSGKSNKKPKRDRKDSSSSDSDSDDSSKAKKKERKKDEIDDEKHSETTETSLKENLLLKDSDAKPLVWERKKLWKKLEERRAKRKEDDDWEASSSAEESEEENKTRESSWDDEATAHESAAKGLEYTGAKADIKENTAEKKQATEKSQDAPELMTQLSSGTLKGSLSVFSFNENSFCSFGQELSRDFFLTDLNCSNSGHLSGNDNSKISTIDPRPFQSVSRDGEVKKAAHSELYSPGHSDSEVSDVEVSKPEKPSSNLILENKSKEEVYDPLNCDSEGSGENNKVEVSSIPLPRVSDILLPGETRNFENLDAILPSNSEGNGLKNLTLDSEKFDIKFSSMTPPLKSSFSSSDFTPIASSLSPLTEDKNTLTKRQLMSVKGQTKLVSKAASVFQDESDEENIEPSSKGKATESAQSETSGGSGETKSRVIDKLAEEKSKHESSKHRKKSRDRSKERNSEKSRKKKRSRSRERRSRSKSSSKRASSPRKERKAKVSDTSREKREIRSDSFEIEPLKSCIESDGLTDLVQPIPVLTGLEPSADSLWSRSVLPVSKFSHAADNLIDNGESFDIYPSEESTYRKDLAEHDEIYLEKLKHQRNKKESRRSRSKSHSPKPKLRSKSPERRRSPRSRSPRRKSASPKRRDKSPFSPKRRSPKRKSPSRRYKKSSRSPDKRRKSRSRSPRKRRGSPRRSRSVSPRKYRSPKHLDESPRRRDSPATTFSSRESFSPRKDTGYMPVLHNRIPVIGTSTAVDDPDRELSPSAMGSPMFENSGAFPRHMPDQAFQEPNMYTSFYEGEYPQEFGMSSYPEEVSANNLITVKNHDLEKDASSERLTLDQRIELELGVAMSAGPQTQSDQYQVCPQFQDTNYFQNSCNCDNGNVSAESFYQNQSVQMNDFNGQYFNGHQPQPNYGPFQKYPNSQPVQNSVLQVGNIVEVVPTSQHPPPPLPSVPSQPTPQIMQVGNVLQVVPSQKPLSQNYPDGSPIVKTQKATAVVAPSSVVPTPNPEAVLSPLIKAIQLEREKRRKEKAKRKAEREARRKARQLRREAKLMLVNEKLKKSVQNEGLMLGQEVEDDELLDGLDVPSPPIPVEIITVSSPNALPPAGKGILITAGFMPKPPSEKKEVKFADGVCPGEGTSTSGGEEIASPPPKPKLPKEKRFKKRKTKVKKKVKVQIIRQIIQEEDDDEDDLSPPPPPPGDPPPVFFARFPFAGEAQFPVYQTQTTTTTLTTVQYPNPSFE